MIGRLWCRLMHDGIINIHRGHYLCAVCHRLWPVPWGKP